jgi:hypothetical protein
MKTGITLIIIGFALMFTQCKKDVDPFSFTFNKDLNLNVPAVSNLIDTTVTIISPEFNLDIDQALNTNGTAGDLIESITLNSASIETLEPAGQAIDYLSQMDISFLSADGGVEKAIASKLFGSKNGYSGSIPLTVAAEAFPYEFLKNPIKLKATIKSKAGEAANIPASTIKNMLNFTIKANPLK